MRTQNRFKESIAAAAEVSVADVTIDKISPARRRLMAGRKLLADGIRVDVSVKAKDNTVATQMASKLTEDKYDAHAYPPVPPCPHSFDNVLVYFNI